MDVKSAAGSVKDEPLTRARSELNLAVVTHEVEVETQNQHDHEKSGSESENEDQWRGQDDDQLKSLPFRPIAGTKSELVVGLPWDVRNVQTQGKWTLHLWTDSQGRLQHKNQLPLICPWIKDQLVNNMPTDSQQIKKFQSPDEQVQIKIMKAQKDVSSSARMLKQELMPETALGHVLCLLPPMADKDVGLNKIARLYIPLLTTHARIDGLWSIVLSTDNPSKADRLHEALEREIGRELTRLIDQSKEHLRDVEQNLTGPLNSSNLREDTSERATGRQEGSQARKSSGKWQGKLSETREKARLESPTKVRPQEGSRQRTIKYSEQIVDNAGECGRVYPLPNQNTTTKIRDAVADYMTMHDNPKSIRMDNGPQFKGEALKKLLMELGIQLVFSIPEQSNTNGVAERAVRTVKDYIKTTAKPNWDEPLELLKLNQYLSQPKLEHSPVKEIKPTSSPFQENDQVWIKTKSTTNPRKGQIRSIEGNVITLTTGEIRHPKQLRKIWPQPT